MKPKYLLTCIAAALLSAISASGQVLLSSGTYTQDFNSLPSSGGANHPWTNNVTLLGWYAAASNSTAAVVGDATGATNIVVGGGASNGGALYSFGTNGVNDITDRAMGSLCSGTTFAIAYGVRFTNDTTHTLTNFTVTYTGEQWRNGGNTSTQPLTFAYRVDNVPITSPDATNITSTGWNIVNALTFISPIATSTAGQLDGNQPANRTLLSGTLSGFVVFPGQEIFLRWLDINDVGSDHALSVDDLTVSFETNDTAAVTGPNISVNPTNVTIAEGNSATFSITAGGTQPLFYQWYYTNSGTVLSIDGANGASFTTNFVPASASGSGFFVVVTNSALTANAATSSVATVTVTPAVAVVTNIAYLHTLHDANYVLTDTNTLYQVEGIVTTSGDLVSSGGQSAYFQDGTGAGMDLFFFTGTAGFTLPSIGDHIRVTGQLSQFDGALEIQLTANPAHKLEVLDSGNPSPTPKNFDFSKGIDPNLMEGYVTNGTTIVPAIEGSYVVISNVFLGITNSGGTLSPNQTVYLTNLTGQVFTMRVPNNALAQTTFTSLPAFAKSVKGAMAQFQTTGTVMTNSYGLYYELPSNIEAGTPPVILVSPIISSISITADGVVLSGTNNNGTTAGNYAVLSSTNISLPINNWTAVSTQAFNADGTFSVTNPIGTSAQQFYLLQPLP